MESYPPGPRGRGRPWFRSRRGLSRLSERWFWLLTVNGPMTRADRVATLEEAQA